jgi:hypothetical protein
VTITAAWAAAEDRRLLGPEAFEAAQLAKGLCCDVVPHPLLDGRFEATYRGGVMIGTAEDLRASRRAQMLGWLWWFTAVGRDATAGPAALAG